MTKVETKKAIETAAVVLENSPAMAASGEDRKVIVNGKELKLAKNISYDGNGKFTDIHGRNVSSIGWTAGRFLGVGMNHLVNAYELDASLAEKLSVIIDELIPVRDSYRVTTKGTTSQDPEVLKQKLADSMAKALKNQKALEEKIRIAELKASK